MSEPTLEDVLAALVDVGERMERGFASITSLCGAPHGPRSLLHRYVTCPDCLASLDAANRDGGA